jgi:exopolysaccharide production protein ExoQ
MRKTNPTKAKNPRRQKSRTNKRGIDPKKGDLKKKQFGYFRKGIFVGLFLFLSIYHAISTHEFSIFDVRGVNCPSFFLKPTGPCILTRSFLPEMMLWTAALVLMALEINWDKGWRTFKKACFSNWPVFIFILLAATSLIWSILPGASLYRLLILIFTTFAGIYIGSTFPIPGILRMLSWFFILICLASLFFIIFLPDIGILPRPLGSGVWEGIFWHRNYLGCFMALGLTVFLINMLTSKQPRKFSFFLNLVGFLIASLLLIKSETATGIIAALISLLAVLLFLLWSRMNKKLKLKHYLIFNGAVFVAGMLLLLNLNFLLGLLGRNTALSGRIPMWNYFFKTFFSKKILLGYGYGAIWHFEGLRLGLMKVLHSGFPVLIGDNGFVDIFLHLGIVGVILLAGLLITGIYLAVKFLLRRRTLLSAYPLVFFIWLLIVNLSLSLILETESLTWLLGIALVASLRSFPNEKAGVKRDRSKSKRIRAEQRR